MPLQIGIIGAGIAGLGAAIGLRRAGHEVEVFEQSQFKNEVGAAITITPNGTRVLDYWGFDHGKAGGLRFINGHTLAAVFSDSLAGCTERYGHPMYHYHRVDLHRTLMELAQNPSSHGFDGSGKPVVIRLAVKVVGIDSLEASLTIEDGSRIQKDLLVIADGINSSFIRDIAGKNEPVTRTGRSVFRCLIPFDEIMADKETRSFFEGEPPGFWIPYSLETKTFCVTYPCRRGELLNVALLHNTREGHEDSDAWHSPASLQDLMNTAKDFHPVVQKIFKKAPEVKVYNLTHRPPLSRLSLGKTVIIGDAAHPMLPTHAQGATLALTEAATLEVLFANISDGSEVEARLHLFHDILHPRCAVTQLLSNAPWYQNADLKTQVARYYKGALPDATALSFSEVYREFFYGWDVRMVVGAALREWEGSKEEGAKGEVSKEERVNGEEKEEGGL